MTRILYLLPTLLLVACLSVPAFSDVADFETTSGAFSVNDGSATTGGPNPTSLSYNVQDIGGGLFEYDFTLVMDNNDGTWAPGQSWGWFIFGDQQNAPSPIADFAMTSPVPSPWTFLSSSGGFHNGPTFGPVTTQWTPSGVGDSFSWSGTSATRLGEGEMLYSFLLSGGGGQSIEFVVATLIPEPSSILLMGFAAVGLACTRRRRG